MIAILPATVVAEGGGIIGDPRVTDVGQLVIIPLQVLVPALIFDRLAITAVPVGTASEAGAGIDVITLVMFLLAIVVVRVYGQELPLTWVLESTVVNAANDTIPVAASSSRRTLIGGALPEYAKYYLVRW